MITVAGEALIDLIVDPAGHIDPRPGGALSTSCVVARLGLPAAFLGRLYGDRFGRLLRADLDHHGVLAAIDAVAGAPATLAVAERRPGRWLPCTQKARRRDRTHVRQRRTPGVLGSAKAAW